MTDGSMTGRPYGGADQKPDHDQPLPGERPDDGEVGAAPEQSPRAAQGGSMSGDVTDVPGNSGTQESGRTPTKQSGGPDATGPTG